MQESLARKLRVLRADRGITLQEAEELTGVTRETLGALEHGQRGAYTSTLQKIAEGYGVTVGELLEEPVPLTEAPPAPLGAEPTKELSLRPETDKLVDMDIDEFVNLLAMSSDDALIDLQQQLMLLLRYRYGPKSFETWEEVHEYMESEEKERGDRAGELLRKVVKENEARATAVIEAREKALTA